MLCAGTMEVDGSLWPCWTKDKHLESSRSACSWQNRNQKPWCQMCTRSREFYCL